MGIRGPKPTLPEIAEKKGNPGKRAINKNHVKPVDGEAPFIAAHLDKDAKAAIEIIIASMPPGTYHKLDGFVLAAMGTVYARHKSCVETLAEEGSLTTTGSTGQEVASPLTKLEIEYARLLLSFSTHLGLTPTARAAMKLAGTEKPKSKFDGLLGGSPKAH